MGAIKDYINQGFTVGDVTVNTFDETGARIRIKDFYDLDLIERQRIVNLAGKTDVELLNIENKITLETDGKLAEYYKSSEIDIKLSNYYNKSETDGKLDKYATKVEIENTYVKNTQLSTQDNPGIISKNEIERDIRETELAYGLGGMYGGVFGSSLTKIEADKIYYYWDNLKKIYTPYLARTTKTGIFITPDVDSFKNISLRDNLFYKRLTVTIPDSGGLRITSAYIVNDMIKIFGYAFDPTALNALPLGSGIANLGTMIPELKSYGVYGTVVPGINLSLGTDFTIVKSYSSISFQSQHNFCIETGVYKGTIR